MTTTSTAPRSATLSFNFQDAATQLDFSRTIDKTLVHRRALAEVFVTDHQTVGRDRFIVAAQLPVGHAVYNDGDSDRHDPLAIIEACRQAALVVAHKSYGVPRDWSFIFRKAEVDIQDTETTRITHGRMLIGINVSRTFEKDGYLTGMNGDFVVQIDGTHIGAFTGSLSFLPSTMMHHLRERSREAKKLPDDFYVSALTPLSTSAVGRAISKNIVIGRRGTDSFEIIDHGNNKALVDHEVDHIAGMVIMEACRQAAIAATFDDTGELYCSVCSYAVEFTEFAEKELPAVCTTTLMGVVDGVAQLHIEVSQQNKIIATVQVSLERTAQHV